jgi:hypothetical protein
MADQVFDARDRFPGPDVPVAIPMDPHDIVELARLRTIERELTRPIVDLLTELAYLRIVAQEARVAMAKVEEHERTGWERITLGAFGGLRRALGRLGRR